MRIQAVNPVGNFGVKKCKNNSKENILNFPSRKLSQYNQLNFTSSPLLYKYTNDFYGLTLLNQTNNLKKNSAKFDSAVDFIQNVGYEKLAETPEIIPMDKENPVIWSITSEFAPIKEGGLGSVPPEIRNNAQKLGVNIPTFIPMYLYEGDSTFLEENNQYFYKKGNKTFPLEKIVSFKMDTFKDGKIQTVPVDIYLNEDEDKDGNKRQLVFIKTDQYFDGTIYESNAKTEEPEKFAVFSKAVYEFAKLKINGPQSLKDVHISSLDKIKEPDAMILNDWQASPVASLMRYKAPMENAYNQLSDESADKLKNMKIATIGHNCMYQGSSASNNSPEQRKESTNNILNTLFDKYTSDIVMNAQTKASSTDKNDGGLVNLDNVLVMNYKNTSKNYVNFLNMGIVLSDFFLPVSQNYASELINPNRNDLSKSLQWALIQKEQSGRMKGIINGNDYANLNIQSKASQIKKTTGIDFEMYDKTSEKEDVINAKKENKFKLYNDFMRPATEASGIEKEQSDKVKQLNPAIEFYKGASNNSLPEIDKKTLDETPVLSLMGRLVSQKGIDVAVDALEKLYKNWDDEFPYNEKPILYIGGQDGENGKQRAKIQDFIDNKLSKEDSSHVIFAHGFVPMSAIMAGSDFFLMPSKFEPCGLTQSESMAVATPVIASAVGGIVDTVNRDGKHTGILTNKNKPIDSDEFYKALVEGLHIFFDNEEEYNNMVVDSLDEDFSWIQKGKKGPVYDYLELFGIKRENLADAE